MKSFLFIGMGGAIGSVLRYLVQLFIVRMGVLNFPLGTFLINITGCFFIGLFYGLVEKHHSLSGDSRLFLITGLCGGFTTFSSYAYESVYLLKQGNYTYFILYVSLSVLLGLTATVLGFSLIR